LSSLSTFLYRAGLQTTSVAIGFPITATMQYSTDGSTYSSPYTTPPITNIPHDTTFTLSS
jgi:hypothetical protein